MLKRNAGFRYDAAFIMVTSLVLRQAGCFDSNALAVSLAVYFSSFMPTHG